MSARTHKVLIVDDDEDVRDLLVHTLRPSYHVKAVPDGESAHEHLKTREYAVLVTDMQLPGMSGIEVVKAARKLSPDTVCFIITGYATVDTAVSAMRHGAYDYMQKPIRCEELICNVKRAVEFHSLKKENLTLREEVRERFSFDNLIGKSKVMAELYEIISVVADSDSNVLITGESGTGKELVAKTIHYNSPRKGGPFIPVNCGAIPADLIESELFGHEKGAFTGAATSRAGRFERADQGTIFLDEIGELALPLQVKLLRVLQEKEIDRVGGTKTIHVDIRVIAATNRNIERAVKERHFREDLYYRLNVIPIHIAPLRERKEDIPLLAAHFLDKVVQKKKKGPSEISGEAMDMLVHYPWPGNIRELENIIERTVILKRGDGAVHAGDLPSAIRECGHASPSFAFDIPGRGVDLANIMEELEKGFIEKALLMSGGVKSKAAELLGMNRTTLIEKMKKRGIASEPPVRH